MKYHYQINGFHRQMKYVVITYNFRACDNNYIELKANVTPQGEYEISFASTHNLVRQFLNLGQPSMNLDYFIGAVQGTE